MKKNTYIYVQLNHSAVYQRLIQHCNLTVLQLKKKKKENNEV